VKIFHQLAIFEISFQFFTFMTAVLKKAQDFICPPTEMQSCLLYFQEHWSLASNSRL